MDWDKWVDEDEQDEADPKKDFDLGDLQNFSNFGGGDFGAGLGGGMSGIGNVEVQPAHPLVHDAACQSIACHRETLHARTCSVEQQLGRRHTC